MLHKLIEIRMNVKIDVQVAKQYFVAYHKKLRIVYIFIRNLQHPHLKVKPSDDDPRIAKLRFRSDIKH